MPAAHPRHRWRLALASAVSATLLAMVAGCGEPSRAGTAAAAAPAADSPGSAAGSEASSATTAASPTPSASASTPGKATPPAAAASSTPSAKANAAGGGRTPGSTPSGGATSSRSTSTGGGSTTRFMGSSTVLIGGSMTDASASAAPFDVRYAYVHSQPAPSSAAYSASLCQSAWTNWWGCWGGNTTAPGSYVTWTDAHVAKATYQ